MSGSAYINKSKIRVLLGDQALDDIFGQTVVDFGCGDGHEAVALAKHGAARVIGVDIRENALANARKLAEQEGVADRCSFVTKLEEPVDRIVSLDAFEHFSDPAGILELMSTMLRPGGRVIASFGPTWYHPLGGHLFSVFPWAHLIFSEKALIRWRNDLRSDGATRFHEVEGGLNCMTIARFERLVKESSLQLQHIETVPIRKLRPIHNAVTREFTSALVRCQLVKPAKEKIRSAVGGMA
jgi:SAM-dependent methyltransferase